MTHILDFVFWAIVAAIVIVPILIARNDYVSSHQLEAAAAETEEELGIGAPVEANVVSILNGPAENLTFATTSAKFFCDHGCPCGIDHEAFQLQANESSEYEAYDSDEAAITNYYIANEDGPPIEVDRDTFLWAQWTFGRQRSGV